MSIESALAELKRERARLDRAIEALEKIELHPGSPKADPARVAAPAVPKRSHLTEAGRKSISEFSKKRWAEWRKKREAGSAKNAKGTSSTGKAKSGKPSRTSRG